MSDRRWANARLGLALLALTAGACNPNFNFNFEWDSGAVSGPPAPPPPPPCCCDVPLLDPTTGVVPARPAGPAAAASGSVVLAVSRLYFDDTDPGGNPSQDAWKKYGLNIDRKFTTEASTNTCTLAVGATCSVRLDGDNGFDNSFGANVVPMLDYLASGLERSTPTYASNANAAVEQGGGTMLVRLDGVGGEPSYAPLPGALYRAVPTTAPPKWDGSDIRDVDDVSLVGADLSRPLAAFPGGYMNERRWVGAPAADTAYIDLHMFVDAAMVATPPIAVRHVQLLLDVAPDNATAAHGILSGVIRTSDLVQGFRIFAGAISTSLCSGSAFESIASQVGQASDILEDGTNVAGRPCDAISIGFGFDAVAVQLGQPRSVPTPQDPCADGG